MTFLGIQINLPKIFRREKREAPRLHIFQTLYLDYKSEAPPVQGSAEARDISMGGLRFNSDKKLPKGTSVTLTLRFAGGSTTVNSLTTRARVVRCSRQWGHKHYQIGCEFERLEESAHEEIDVFIHWLKVRNEKYIHFRYGDVDIPEDQVSRKFSGMRRAGRPAQTKEKSKPAFPFQRKRFFRGRLW